ncbi:MAG: Spy/CpxP family protein refolding chaperone [Candidatus Obscuribacterales bacterium]|nr:Spy/CpxP family protein refolding chaperone [Candidatus Obscuribacterales bacterium]
MSHKIQWRGLIAAAALLLPSPPVFSQEQTVIQMTKDGPEDILFAYEAGVPEPIQGFAIGAGEFGPPPGGPPFLMPPGGPPFGAKFSMPVPPFANLDLTDEQITQLAKLKRAFESASSSSFATLRALEDEMREKLSADNISESDAGKLAEQIAQHKADLSKRLSMHILESAKVLTPEQRKKMRLAQDRLELVPMGSFGKPPWHPGK